MNRLTAEEVCRTIELICLFTDEDWAEEIYELVHYRQGQKCCQGDSPHISIAISNSRKLQEYWENASKAPADPTKVHNMKYPK